MPVLMLNYHVWWSTNTWWAPQGRDACAPLTLIRLHKPPSSHIQACSECYGSSRNCQTTGSDGPGVKDTDFVLYVSAINTATCAGSTIAYASSCHQEDTFDRYNVMYTLIALKGISHYLCEHVTCMFLLYNFRPIAGHANFCPSKISAADSTDDFILAVAKHEILHALVWHCTDIYN